MGEQFSIRLTSSTQGVGLGSPVEAVITVRPQVISTFRIASNNLINVVTSPQELAVVIERVSGQQSVAQINYNTSQPRQPVAVGGLAPFPPAQPQIDFSQIQTSLTFNSGDESRTVRIPILSVGTSPAAFLVQIGSTVQ